MISSVAAILLYLGMLYFKLWDLIPQQHKWWIGFALVLLFLWGPTERTIVVKKVLS